MTALRSHRWAPCWALSLLLVAAAPLPLLAAGPKPAEGGEAVKVKLKSADERLSVLDVQRSREILEEVAHDPKTKAASKKLRARVYATLGRVRAELGDELGMDDAFSEAVKLDRGVKLPRSASPKILDALERIRAGAPKDEPPPHRPDPVKRPEPKPDAGVAARQDAGSVARADAGGPADAGAAARPDASGAPGRDAAAGLAVLPVSDGGASTSKDGGAGKDAGAGAPTSAKDASTPDAGAARDAGPQKDASSSGAGVTLDGATPKDASAMDAGAQRDASASDAGPQRDADTGRSSALLDAALPGDAGRNEGRSDGGSKGAADAGLRAAEPTERPRPGLRAEILGPRTSLSRVQILAVPTLLPESATYYARIRRAEERRFMPFLMTRTGTVAVLELRLTEARYELFLEAKDRGKVIARAGSADAPLVIETEQAPPIARAWAEPDLSPHPSPAKTSSSSTTALALGGQGFNSTTTWLVAGGVVAAAVLITIVVLVASGGSNTCSAKEGFGCTEIRVLPLIGGD